MNKLNECIFFHTFKLVSNIKYKLVYKNVKIIKFIIFFKLFFLCNLCTTVRL